MGNNDNVYFIFVTDDDKLRLDGVDICLHGERERRDSDQREEDLAMQAARDYLVGMYDVDEVYVWVLAPDKTVSRYTMTIEIVYHISKD